MLQSYNDHGVGNVQTLSDVHVYNKFTWVHLQLHQAITICLMLPVNCVLFAWHALGYLVLQAYQMLDNHMPSSTKHLTANTCSQANVKQLAHK